MAYAMCALCLSAVAKFAPVTDFACLLESSASFSVSDSFGGVQTLLSLPALALLIAVPSQVPEGFESLQDSSFPVTGWLCGGDGCKATPRHLEAALLFSQRSSHGVFERAEKTETDWGVTLDCVVSRTRLKSCRVVDEPYGASRGLAIAMKLAEAVRLRPGVSGSSRAIISVNYEIGGCPSWFCVRHPFAPPPPPAAT
ncbi:hypothetical protein [Sphingomonas sp. BAUL-RG-20F-R05-02]|uniref:hypothetical protein n=1 Tax=Sphingomonas sp. BAUL-RG-20F-R05-02 TaxID=2914830 RepID=UPI001F59077C|nr:hypothetical protein [Sphingomonas sp. BAUL-RG-20F-R05-02]